MANNFRADIGPPLGSLGSQNDYYLNTLTKDLYKKTGANFYEVIVNLNEPGPIGPEGPQGPQGPPGPEGPPGMPPEGINFVGTFIVEEDSVGGIHLIGVDSTSQLWECMLRHQPRRASDESPSAGLTRTEWKEFNAE